MTRKQRRAATQAQVNCQNTQQTTIIQNRTTRATRLQDTCFDPITGELTNEKLFALYQRYATTHERAFHKCLSILLTNRIQNEKSQVGFESQKRKSQLYELNLAAKTMQYTDQQRRFYANPANGLPPEAQKFMDQAA
jgi:hypothetical protein